jgi:hypothetical protein
MNPYVVKCPDYTFFINYGDKKNLKYESIRPGTTVKDPVVTDLREIQYLPSGEIYFKIDFAKNINLRECQFGNLFSTTRKITKKKFEDLQQIKLYYICLAGRNQVYTAKIINRVAGLQEKNGANI